ncbi:MAG: hypothetical protein A2725_03245 [Candidatus Magasanikbacteria bacterium RIFCSPHIGHO2_01_FULL_33_34]|uniref:ATP-grasp domain-containing protein n=1 Tax=Candidatus Magasanikbacteria bacterium RIFCSPHIGHO2_01_FULL_33_34 TaxID=1798671 RepID=A0A1F6LH27_9BACT|nr:MAG: hypothetical protein A2725_03245 [Candidatus Magasanikbacteria bacterium RIFCSPHIGHO2_01_FULL_33_34]OGH66146.1 MAG: hypothetical protein A3B83_00735 [Candidatus Magasanikbacteria bacterium RIFCSPHIGHO2_02_FULL_33_17]OGH75992.1 MAG: hypothetical protein A3A89_00645 [Candidatus Magasanikbacteria bacterium RIFCSPLOWO2_01_FULL_33_34]OGH81566.1 MAG: hypothetical protein A3F93_03330 [Candidatus Magasanikbacteria bacterium RIFCSPLOWO2_12_FULL_34_7]
MSNQKGKQTAQIINKIFDQMIKAVNDTGEEKQKNIILFVGKIQDFTYSSIEAYNKSSEKKYRIGLIYDSKSKFDLSGQKIFDSIEIKIPCDINNPSSIQKALLPYQDELLAITCRGEDKIPTFSKIIPHVPYLNTPSSKSLEWASDKIMMRERLRIHNKNITPAFTIIKDYKNSSIKKIEDEVGFPIVVKPSGLAASRLVSICFHKEELEQILKKIFKKIDSVYKENNFTGEPQVLVEKFMDGEMYSIDGYVNRRGIINFCPMVHIKTGRSIGFDDFFGYQQITPTLLGKEKIINAEFVAQEAVHALALRNTTVHVEMIKTESGWKIIELAARAGGFRHQMYKYSYDIDHTLNDIYIHIPEKTIIPKKVLGYTVAMKFFAKQEGTLTKLTGIKKIQLLSSFKEISVNKNIGDMCLYAKNGGNSVFNLIMFNKERSKLLADIRRVEQTIEIETSKNGNTK